MTKDSNQLEDRRLLNETGNLANQAWQNTRKFWITVTVILVVCLLISYML